jgi:hypothetical protein
LDWLENASNFSAGFGDTVSFGLTRKVRQWMDTDKVVSRDSGWYKGGIVTGVAHGVAMGGAGIAKGVAKTGSQSVKRQLYEIGQKTLSKKQYNYFVGRNLDPVKRGIDIVRHQGWLRAKLPSPTGLLTQSWKTVGTGLTPLASQGWVEGLAVGYGTATATYDINQLPSTFRQRGLK